MRELDLLNHDRFLDVHFHEKNNNPGKRLLAPANRPKWGTLREARQGGVSSGAAWLICPQAADGLPAERVVGGEAWNVGSGAAPQPAAGSSRLAGVAASSRALRGFSLRRREGLMADGHIMDRRSMIIYR